VTPEVGGPYSSFLVHCYSRPHNSKYGQPGPLAYKLDTLIINRRIEEAPRPIPKIIRLGSHRDLCRELERTEGENVNCIGNALRQNASAFITAKGSLLGTEKIVR
jgi:hypothetical protein